MPRFVKDFFYNLFVFSGTCTWPEVVLRAEIERFEVSSMNKLFSHLKATDCQILEQISTFLQI